MPLPCPKTLSASVPTSWTCPAWSLTRLLCLPGLAPPPPLPLLPPVPGMNLPRVPPTSPSPSQQLPPSLLCSHHLLLRPRIIGSARCLPSRVFSRLPVMLRHTLQVCHICHSLVSLVCPVCFTRANRLLLQSDKDRILPCSKGSIKGNRKTLTLSW